MENKKNNGWEEEREIRIKVSPKRVLKLASFFVLLIFAFYLGRWTMPESVATEAVVVEAPEESSESSFSFTGWVTGLFAGDGEEEVNATEPATATAPAASESAPAEPTTDATVPATTNTTPASSTPTGAAAADDGDVITTYNKVALALTAVKKDWKETWGKVTSFDLTVKNNEDGTVKSSYIIMNMEGYDDYDKRIIFGQTIKAGKTLQYTIPVPKGFSYKGGTPGGAGDLSSVDITIQLYDASNKLISTTTNAMNLQG